jgi:hypothetical protein
MVKLIGENSPNRKRVSCGKYNNYDWGSMTISEYRLDDINLLCRISSLCFTIWY